MMIPGTFGWKQPNTGDTQGTIWSSRNLDLTTKIGSLMVSARLLLNVNTTDLANLTAPPCAFRFFVGGASPGANVFTIAKQRVFRSNVEGPQNTFIQDATASTPTACNSDQSDLEILPTQNYMFASEASTTLKYLTSAGAWGSASSTLVDSSGLKMMNYFRAQNRLYIVDDNSTSISSVSNASTPAITAAAASTQYTLKNLVAGGSSEVISWIKSTSTRQWIGTINFTGGGFHRIYSWDGSSTSVNESYVVEGAGSLSCVIKNDTPHIFTTEGKLFKCNGIGGSFTEVAKLPFENKRTHDISGTPTNRMCHYNGMSLVKGNINILVNTTLYDNTATNQHLTTLLEKVPSGVWEYIPSPDGGMGTLYHKASVGLTKSGGTIKDYGQLRVKSIGAIGEVDVKNNNITVTSLNGNYMVGCDYYTDATNSTSGLFYDDSADTLQKYGCVILPKIFSPNVEDSWQLFYARHRKLLNSNDSITVKYRITEADPVEATITWVSTTQFTTTTDVSAYVAGDEVEITQGDGAGRTAHISSISVNGGTYTVNLDTTITGATTNTGKAFFQAWKKIISFTDQTVQLSKYPLTNVASTWVQFKICMMFQGKDEIQGFILANTKHE